MTTKEAIDVALDYLEEHRYEDRGYDYNECPSCGWNNREDVPKGAPDWGPEPHHRPGCKLYEAIVVLRKEIE